MQFKWKEPEDTGGRDIFEYHLQMAYPGNSQDPESDQVIAAEHLPCMEQCRVACEPFVSMLSQMSSLFSENSAVRCAVPLAESCNAAGFCASV